jgi:hypothetical protein
MQVIGMTSLKYQMRRIGFWLGNLPRRKIKKAVFQMEHNKSPGPDGFLAEFYQVFWEVITVDLMALFMSFTKAGCRCLVSTLVHLFYYPSARKQLKFSNLDRLASLM